MKALIAYASMTGNSEQVAKQLSNVLTDLNVQHDLKSLDQISGDDLLNYNDIIIGSSTWTDGQFNPTALPFFEQLQASTLDLNQQNFLLFALGESFYPSYATVGELAQKILEDKQGNVNPDILKIDGYPEADKLKEASEWLKKNWPN